jgi:hypothetical protein
VSLATALSAYAALNAALAVAACGSQALGFARAWLGARALLSTNYLVFVALCVALPLGMMLPETSFISPSARIWAGASPEIHGLSTTAAIPGRLALGAATFDAGSVGRVWIATALALLAFGLVTVVRDLARLHAIHRHSYRVRRIGRVSIWMNDAVATPFS